ncbi:MAG: 4-hydroxythreonine-4-phosphate dehydrogenase PdxA [Gammaproteobacteria bacterium]|nr:MAG: 4-hydroxythreonine-4-phosphate dehydrogenase PdxA [Gammaproteobacteria bacterium]
MSTPPVLALTPGEPAGIGPDLAIMLSQQRLSCPIIIVADPGLLQQRAKQLDMAFDMPEWNDNITPDRACYVLPVPLQRAAVAGELLLDNARYVLNTLDVAVEGCLSNRFQGLVTGPVHKGVINDAGIPFSGHTEYLAAKTQTSHVVMMLATTGLRVALATTHLPLRDVAAHITAERLTAVTEILHTALVTRFHIKTPRISICGLNPHAGEGGHLGDEEQNIIAPVIASLRLRGWHLDGPLPADTAFTPDNLKSCDAILTMYHDQGLPVLKHMGFGKAVNITLGLPFVRTSVDHGTALERAGRGNIHLGSLMAAIDNAQRLLSP